MEKQKCPEVRFKKFDGLWDSKLIEDILKIKSGMSQKSVEVEKGIYPILATGGEIGRTNTALYDKESVLIGRKGTIDKPYYMNSPFWTVDTLFYSELASEVVGYFVYSIFQKINWRHHNTSTGVPSLTSSAIHAIEINIPDKTEQGQIGQFFQNLDQSISLHEKKLAQTQNFKKAMLEKMFPKQGSKCPEIRLKGFSRDWEPFTLGSLCHIGDIDHRMPESREQGIPYLMTGDFIGINELDFRNAKRISNEDYEQLAKKIKPEAGDILFARYASVGTVRYVKTHLKFLISYSCAILKTSVNSNGEYLFYYLQTKCSKNQIEQEINTGSQRNIGIDSLKKLSILMPKDDEQRAIADFFRKIDENLVLQEKQLQTLKNLKQALLEKMFV